MKKTKKFPLKFLLVFPYFIVFIASIYGPTDPDLGWHLKYGEYFFQHGHILRDNTFSVMMPNFHWINHSYGTDILTYAIFHLGGFLGLTIVSALIVTATFFFFSKATDLTLWDETLLFPILLILLDPINNVSFRSQLLSLMFLGILFYIISLSRRKNIKYLFLAVPLFLIWANIHGEFILGIGIYVLWMILSFGYQFIVRANPAQRESREALRQGQGKRVLDSIAFRSNNSVFVQLRFFIVVFILSILAGMVNPFGIGVYYETLHHFGNPLAQYIAEWTPLQQLSGPWWRQIVLGILIAFGTLFLFFSGKNKDKFPFIGLAIILFFLPFWARRYAWPSYYLTLPILFPLSSFFKPDGKKTTFYSTIVILVLTLVIVIALKYPFTQFSTYSWNTYCQNENILCSPKSAQYLESHNLNKNLYSLYGWGGWLIWNYPKIKPTIDGRMSFWVDDKGYSGFKDYFWYEQNFKDIDKSSYDVVYMSPYKPIYNQMIKLVQLGKWKMVFQDKAAGIFVRK